MLGWNPVVAQSQNCAQALSSAQQLYAEGKLLQIDDVLRPCIKVGFSQEERVKAYRLLTLSFLFTNQKEKAEEAFIRLIRIAPDYVIDTETDPLLLQHLYQEYKTSPVVSFQLTLGGNRSLVEQMASYGPSESSGNYASKTSIQVGLSSNIYFKRQFSVQVGLLNTYYSFLYSNTILDYTTIRYTENQSWLNIPISLHYHFGRRKMVPYVFAGLQYQRLLSSTAAAIREQDIGRDLELNGIVAEERRQPQQLGLRTGAGINYRLKRLGILIQATYTHGLYNQVRTNKRYSNKELLYNYGYVDDDFKLHQLVVELGLTYSIYNPKKLKSKD